MPSPIDGTRRSRRWVLTTAATATIAGCLGGDGSGSDGSDGGDGDGSTGSDDGGGPDAESNPALGDVEETGGVTLESPAFEAGGEIPERFGYDAQNVNPPLTVDGVPGDAGSLALVMDDPDALEPAGEVWDHWLVWNVPPDTSEIPEDWEPAAAVQGTNDYGEVGYGGPAPPDEPHRYRFKLFALAADLDLPTDVDAAALGAAMAGDVLARTQLDGTYAP